LYNLKNFWRKYSIIFRKGNGKSGKKFGKSGKILPLSVNLGPKGILKLGPLTPALSPVCGGEGKGGRIKKEIPIQ